MKEKIWGLLLMGLGLVVILLSVWYMVSPKSVRAFHRKYREFDRRGNIGGTSDLKIRATGVVLLLIGVLYEVGVFVVFEII